MFAVFLLAFTVPVAIASKARQYEVGLKAVSGGSYLYLPGFYTKFDPLNASFAGFNSATGRADVTTTFVGTAETKGMEADGRPLTSGQEDVAPQPPGQHRLAVMKTGQRVQSEGGRQTVRGHADVFGQQTIRRGGLVGVAREQRLKYQA